jgi:hypothetical protein
MQELDRRSPHIATVGGIRYNKNTDWQDWRIRRQGREFDTAHRYVTVR